MPVKRIPRSGLWLPGALAIVICITPALSWAEQADATTSASRTTAEAPKEGPTSASRATVDATTSASRAEHEAPGAGTAATGSASRAPRTQRELSGTLYNFAAGPALRFCLLAAALGILYRLRQFIRLTRRRPARRPLSPRPTVAASPPARRSLRSILFVGPAGPKSLSHPTVRTVSLIFHGLLFLVPLLLPAHNMILYHSIHARLPAIPAQLADWLTIILVLLGGFFLVRRLAVPRVRVLSTLYDYLILVLVLAPFVTGLMLYHHVSSSRWLMIGHIVAGDAVLLAIPFTKLGHMPFLLFSRFSASGEYAWKPARRAWGRGA